MMHATHYRIHPKVVAYRHVDIVDESVALENRDDLLAIFLIDADSGAEPDSDGEAWTDGPAIAAASARKISGSVYLPPNHRYAPSNADRCNSLASLEPTISRITMTVRRSGWCNSATPT
jgi:hypothetical protein